MTSTLLFNIFIYDLIRILNADNRASLAYADDIMVCCSGSYLFNAIESVELWCTKNFIQINKSKSQILQLKIDNRTPDPSYRKIRGIPIRTSAKYLGVTIDNNFSF